jgi:RES domain-containing protein
VAAGSGGDVVEGFYLADSEATAWAEWYRALAEYGIPPLRQLPRDLWTYRVTIERVADLSSVERLARVGLAPPAPDRRQWPPCQVVGETLFAEGWAGLVYESAARTDSRALCLFRPTESLAGVRPTPPPRAHNEPPVVPRRLRT